MSIRLIRPRRSQVLSPIINEYSDTDDDEFFVDVVGLEKSNKANTPDWMINLKIMNRTVRFKVDTGAQCNVVPECVHTKICNKLQRSNDRLVSFSGDRMKPIGKCTMLCERKSKLFDIEFQVLPGKVQPIIGLKTCERLGLIKRIDILVL